MLGAVRAGADRHFLERSVVVVEARGAGAFGHHHAFDHRPVLIGFGVVGRIAGLRARGAAADVDALELHGGRGRHDRPQVACVRQRRQLLRVEVGDDARCLLIDDGRFAGDGQGLLHRRNLHLHVDRRVEADGDAPASRARWSRSPASRRRGDIRPAAAAAGDTRRRRSRRTGASPCSAGLVAVMVTPGRAAALVSPTVPSIEAVVAPADCARASRA